MKVNQNPFRCLLVKSMQAAKHLKHLLVVGKVIGSTLSPKHVIAKTMLLCQTRDIKRKSRYFQTKGMTIGCYLATWRYDSYGSYHWFFYSFESFNSNDRGSTSERLHQCYAFKAIHL